MLHDRFVTRINIEKSQQTLLAEIDLTFDRALSIATAIESASKNVQAMTSGSLKYKPRSQLGDKKHTKF